MKDEQDKSGGATMVSVRYSKPDLDAVREAAEKRGETVSTFLRRVSLTEAKGHRSGALLSTAAPTQSATIGAVLQFTDSGRFVASALLPPTPSTQFGLGSASSPGDFSQRAFHGVRDFTARYDEDAG